MSAGGFGGHATASTSTSVNDRNACVLVGPPSLRQGLLAPLSQGLFAVAAGVQGGKAEVSGRLFVFGGLVWTAISILFSCLSGSTLK